MNYNNDKIFIDEVKINVNNNKIEEINIILNKVSKILNKTDIIILDWFEYDLLNRSSNIIFYINNLIPYIEELIKEIHIAVKIYKDIGNKIINNIDYIIIGSSVIFFIILSIQLLFCYKFANLYYNYNYNYNNNNNNNNNYNNYNYNRKLKILRKLNKKRKLNCYNIDTIKVI